MLLGLRVPKTAPEMLMENSETLEGRAGGAPGPGYGRTHARCVPGKPSGAASWGWNHWNASGLQGSGLDTPPGTEKKAPQR